MDKSWLLLKFNKWRLTYVEGKLETVGSSNIPPTIIETPEIQDWFFENNIDYLPRVDYCWQVGNYLVTLLDDLDKDTVVTIKAFYRSEKGWLSSNLNNANFLKDIWLSFWTQEWLGEHWYEVMEESYGSCDWDLTDTPITLSKLSKALHEFTDWAKELDKDREAGEWEVINQETVNE